MLPPYHDGLGAAADSYSIRRGDGFPEFMGELNGYGNAVVPQIPELIGRAILNTLPPRGPSAAASGQALALGDRGQRTNHKAGA